MDIDGGTRKQHTSSLIIVKFLVDIMEKKVLNKALKQDNSFADV